ncbi:hypothetical protein Ahy_A03g011490 [Arachis hypogaea]|uniref:Casein kinase substrate phosphoprotein PP28 domain-containing protein n=1 Tax=Arachis hypogaea TaxID=3818 RepID=A0A445DQV6_ARAHY|nr:hypothetical protein Ahy_A03g011490 [Arachis hypogaea]
MGRGKFKSKPTGRRQFSTPEDMAAGTSSRPKTFRQKLSMKSQNRNLRKYPRMNLEKNLKEKLKLGKQPSFQGGKERLALIRQQRAEAAKKREEEKAAKEQKKAEARK